VPAARNCSDKEAKLALAPIVPTASMISSKSSMLSELRAREFYEKPTAERKRKLAAAVKRHYKRIRSQQLPKKMF